MRSPALVCQVWFYKKEQHLAANKFWFENFIYDSQIIFQAVLSRGCVSDQPILNLLYVMVLNMPLNVFNLELEISSIHKWYKWYSLMDLRKCKINVCQCWGENRFTNRNLISLTTYIMWCYFVVFWWKCVPDQRTCDCIVSLAERSRIDKIQINKSICTQYMQRDIN